MNRQIRRANEKSDQRRERDQTKRKDQKQASRILRSARPTPAAKPSSSRSGSDRPKTAMSRPWVVRAYLIFSVFVILSQAVVPQRTDILSLVVHAFFYVTLGYSLCLWLYQRGTKRAFIFTLVGGLLLALLVEGIKFAVPAPSQALPGTTTGPNLLFVALAVPGLLLGSWLGQYIYRRS